MDHRDRRCHRVPSRRRRIRIEFQSFRTRTAFSASPIGSGHAHLPRPPIEQRTSRSNEQTVLFRDHAFGLRVYGVRFWERAGSSDPI